MSQYCILLVLLLPGALGGEAAIDGGFSFPLVYRDAPRPPPAAASPVAHGDASQTPAASSPASALSMWLQEQKYAARLEFLGLRYHVEVLVGSTRETFYLDFDTGSDLTWIRCIGGDGTRFIRRTSSSPIYNPFFSSSYKNLDRSHPLCWNDYRIKMTDHGCEFRMEYADKGTAEGLLASETFHFDIFLDRGGFYHSFEDVVFGCAMDDNSKHTAGSGSSGFLGLNYGPLSFVSQLSIKKFSYCIPQPNSGRSSIRFGSDARTPGEKTALVIMPPPMNMFAIKLRGISFGSSLLPIKFPYQGYNEMIVDSGTDFTLLPKDAFEQLLKAVAKNTKAQQGSYPTDMCFWGSMRDMDGITITLHFENNVDLYLFGTQLFKEYSDDGYICLQFMEMPIKMSPEVALLGSYLICSKESKCRL